MISEHLRQMHHTILELSGGNVPRPHHQEQKPLRVQKETLSLRLYSSTDLHAVEAST